MSESSDGYRRVEALYQRALDQPANKRLDFVRQHCNGDESLRREVEVLLEHYDAAQSSFLNSPAHALCEVTNDESSLPESIGRYRILGKLGEGGMGVVYRARQENPKREVALKVIRSGVTARESLKRFELEAVVLGRLHHPGIAQIHEAGTHDDGGGPRPFFAMELVDGLPLTLFAQRRNLGIRARLELFARVCDAAHHAHQKGVVHRDLKPTNILVTEETTDGNTTQSASDDSAVSRPSARMTDGSRASPKILDFGVARAADSDLQVTTAHTDVGQMIGTLPYMSPEQLAGNVPEIDVRSDVYALGVILYELLSGRLPFDVKDKSLAAAARTISENEPVPLGTMDRALRGDLNTLVLKALEKEPDRRYPSASDLAADIRRYLREEPISARPATTIYHLRKFARRNRGLVAGIAAAFVILLAGVIVSSAFAVGRQKALNESERQRRIAQAVNDFLNNDLLANANPGKQFDRNVSLREVLDRASQSIAERFPGEPLVEAAVRTTLSDTYKGLGEFAESGRHAKRALELLRTTLPETHPDIILGMNRVGSSEQSQGRFGEAEKIYRDALQLASRAHGDEHESTLSVMNNLALLLVAQKKLQEAADLLEPVVERRTRLLGEEHQHTMTSLNNLAMVYVNMERFEEGERLHLKEIELCKRVLGAEHPLTLTSMNNVAVLYDNRGDAAKAEPLMRHVYETRVRTLGPDHPSTLTSMDSMGSTLARLKRFEEAEQMLTSSLARREAVGGQEDPKTLQTRDRLASLYLAMKRVDEAESIARANYEARRRIMGEDHASTGMTLSVLARICIEAGKTDEAQVHGQKSFEILERTYGPKHSQTRKVAEILRDLYQRLERPETAAEWAGRAGA